MCENKFFCKIVMPSDYTKIYEFNQFQKSYKAPFFIYADPECLLKTIYGCKKTPENSSTTKVGDHIPSGFLVSTIFSFKIIEKSMMYAEVKTAWKSFANPHTAHRISSVNVTKSAVNCGISHI